MKKTTLLLLSVFYFIASISLSFVLLAKNKELFTLNQHFNDLMILVVAVVVTVISAVIFFNMYLEESRTAKEIHDAYLAQQKKEQNIHQ